MKWESKYKGRQRWNPIETNISLWFILQIIHVYMFFLTYFFVHLIAYFFNEPFIY